jgi:hypothetical protein
VAAATALTLITPSRLLGKTIAIFNLTQNLLGLATAPTIFAVVSEHVFSGPRALAHAMTLCYGIFMATAVILLVFVARELRCGKIAVETNGSLSLE